MVATVYGVGMASMSYFAYLLAEAMVWPILQKRACSFGVIDAYLSSARGSLISMPKSVHHISYWPVSLVLFCILIAQLLLLANATLVGLVFDLQNVTTTYVSIHAVGGGTGFNFHQTNPPSPFPAAVGMAARLYASWADGLSEEPLPELRDFLVDRANISLVGGVVVEAVRVNKTVTCSGRKLSIIADYRDDTHHFEVEAMGNQSVQLRLQPHLSVWVDSFQYPSPTRTISTIVFAALNGTIENGKYTNTLPAMKSYGYANISAVACNVDISLENDMFSIGQAQYNATVLSDLNFFGDNDRRNTSRPWRHNEMAKWLGCAITTYGPNVWGAQPMFKNDGYLPSSYTTDQAFAVQAHHWTLAKLTRFINVGSGALGITVMRAGIQNYTEMISNKQMPRVSTSRSYILLGSPIAILVIVSALIGVNLVLYHQSGISRMFLGRTYELVKSSQTEDMRRLVGDGQLSDSQMAVFAAQPVSYGIVTDGRSRRGFVLDSH